MRRFANDPARTLVSFLGERRRQGMPLPLLWLGAGSSISAGCLTERSLLESMSERLGYEVTSYEQIERWLIAEHYTLLVSPHLRGRPSFGYRLLAWLIALGYFPIILTTNWDFLLQDEMCSLMSSEHIVVCTRPEENDQSIARKLNQLGANTALILRLHGDLRNPIHQPGERLDIAIELRDQLRQLIAARGLIFLGTRCPNRGSSLCLTSARTSGA